MGFSFSEHRLTHQMQNNPEQPQQVPQQQSSPESAAKMQYAAEQMTIQRLMPLNQSVNAARNRLLQNNNLQVLNQLQAQYQQAFRAWFRPNYTQQQIFEFKQQFAQRMSPLIERQTGFRVNPGNPGDANIGLDRSESPYRPLTPKESILMQNVSSEVSQLAPYFSRIARRPPTFQESALLIQRYVDSANAKLDAMNDPEVRMRFYAGVPTRIFVDYNGSMWEQRKVNNPVLNTNPLNLNTPVRGQTPTSEPTPIGSTNPVNLNRVGMAAAPAPATPEAPENTDRKLPEWMRKTIMNFRPMASASQEDRKEMNEWLTSLSSATVTSAMPQPIQRIYAALPEGTRKMFNGYLNQIGLQIDSNGRNVRSRANPSQN